MTTFKVFEYLPCGYWKNSTLRVFDNSPFALYTVSSPGDSQSSAATPNATATFSTEQTLHRFSAVRCNSRGCENHFHFGFASNRYGTRHGDSISLAQSDIEMLTRQVEIALTKLSLIDRKYVDDYYSHNSGAWHEVFRRSCIRGTQFWIFMSDGLYDAELWLGRMKQFKSTCSSRAYFFAASTKVKLGLDECSSRLGKLNEILTSLQSRSDDEAVPSIDRTIRVDAPICVVSDPGLGERPIGEPAAKPLGANSRSNAVSGSWTNTDFLEASILTALDALSSTGHGKSSLADSENLQDIGFLPSIVSNDQRDDNPLGITFPCKIMHDVEAGTENTDVRVGTLDDHATEVSVQEIKSSECTSEPDIEALMEELLKIYVSPSPDPGVLTAPFMFGQDGGINQSQTVFDFEAFPQIEFPTLPRWP